MSIGTSTPARVLTPPGFTRLLTRLATAGWRVEIPANGNAPRPSFALVARGSDPHKKSVTMVIHGYDGSSEVRLDDLWRVIAHLNDLQGDRAMLCVPPGCTVSELALRTAGQLGVEVAQLESA